MPLTNVIIKIHLVLLFALHNTKNIAYHITEVLTFYVDKLTVMGNLKNEHPSFAGNRSHSHVC